MKKTFLINQLKNYIKTYDTIQKVTTGPGDDHTTVCLLDYNYFIKHYKLIAIDLMLIQKQCNKLILLEIYVVQIIE